MNTNSDPKDLYRELVLDHARSPRNARRLAKASHYAEGHNPLCGDRVAVYLRTRDSRVAEISFEGAGCAISTASASMMTDMLKGSTTEGANRLIEDVCKWLSNDPSDGTQIIGEPISALAEVRAFPTRIRCATLPWATAGAALRSDNTIATTERRGTR
jgi:nitrogen fixation NifU-like protein